MSQASFNTSITLKGKKEDIGKALIAMKNDIEGGDACLKRFEADHETVWHEIIVVDRTTGEETVQRGLGN